jgi:hypothetical protein
VGATLRTRPSLPQLEASADRRQLGAKRAGALEHFFYFLMSLLIAIVVLYGFSRTVETGLIHPPSPRPIILYFHAVIFTGWVAFFIVQSALVRTRNLKLHRQLGWFGLVLGVAIPTVGIATAIAMGRLHAQEGRSDAAQFLIVPFFDMVAFSVPFGLSIHLRKKPELHRRLSLIATCSLTAAAFGRFPATLIPHYWFYAGVDSLIFLGVVRDLVVTKRVHPVYVYALLLLALCQTTTIHVFVTGWPVWIRIAHALLT